MKELLNLARKAIKCHFKNEEVKVNEKIKKKYSDKKACFVTLTKNRELRGCIGSLKPCQELYKDVIENSINAGFHDFRFLPLSENELKKIKIEISVLSVPKKLSFNDEKDLLKKINKEVGIILRKDERNATFLPQVWEQIPNKEQFLKQLSLKAGLEENAWKDSDIWFYEVKKIGGK